MQRLLTERVPFARGLAMGPPGASAMRPIATSDRLCEPRIMSWMEARWPFLVRRDPQPRRYGFAYRPRRQSSPAKPSWRRICSCDLMMLGLSVRQTGTWRDAAV